MSTIKRTTSFKSNKVSTATETGYGVTLGARVGTTRLYVRDTLDGPIWDERIRREYRRGDPDQVYRVVSQEDHSSTSLRPDSAGKDIGLDFVWVIFTRK